MTWSESALSESALDDDASMRRSDVETAATPRSRSIAMGPLAAMWRRGALGRSSGDNGNGGGGGGGERGGVSGGGGPGASAGGGFRQVPSRLSRGSGQRRYVKDQEEEEEVDPLGLNGRHLVEEGGADAGGPEEGGAAGGGAEGRAAGAGKEGRATGGAEEVGAIRGGSGSAHQVPAVASGEIGSVGAVPDRQGAGVDGGAGTSGAAAVPETEVEAADAAPPRSLPRKEAPKAKAKGAASPRKATRPAFLYLDVRGVWV